MAEFEFSENRDGNNDPYPEFNFSLSLEAPLDLIPPIESITSSETPVVSPDNPWGFQQEFDGGQLELSIEEQLAVRSKFGAIFDDFYLEHIGDLESPVDGYSLLLNYNLPDNRHLETEIAQAESFYKIDISLAIGDDPEGTGSLYEIDDDGTVIRTDRKCLIAKYPDQDLLETNPEEYRTQLQIHEASKRNSDENIALEKQMGLNGQPVGIDEIDALRGLLEKSHTMSTGE